MRATPATRRDFTWFTSLTTRWSDNDVYGHMNNTKHYQVFDTAVNSYLLEAGLIDLGESETVFLVVETGCHYFGEMGFPDLVTAGIRVSDLGTSSVRYEIGLFRNDDTTTSAQGHFVHVQVAREGRRPIALGENARKQLGTLQS